MRSRVGRLPGLSISRGLPQRLESSNPVATRRCGYGTDMNAATDARTDLFVHGESFRAGAGVNVSSGKTDRLPHNLTGM